MPVLPLCASAGQSSSSTDEVPWSGGQCIILTPDCLRDTVQKNMKTPGCVKIPKPDRESMTCTNLLQYHAQSLLDSHLYPAEKRKRITQKQAVSDNELLHQLVKDPMKVIIHYKMDWAEKRRLHGFVAHITAFHYGIRVVEARAAIKDLWRDVTKDKLHNWKLLESRFETPVLSSEGKNDDEPDVQELYGGIFTWHTLLGRNSGVIARLFAVGCKLDVIAEAAACDPDIRREWQCFVLWLNAIAQSHGFDCTAMCMELLRRRGQKIPSAPACFLGKRLQIVENAAVDPRHRFTQAVSVRKLFAEYQENIAAQRFEPHEADERWNVVLPRAQDREHLSFFEEGAVQGHMLQVSCAQENDTCCCELALSLAACCFFCVLYCGTMRSARSVCSLAHSLPTSRSIAFTSMCVTHVAVCESLGCAHVVSSLANPAQQ